MHCHSPKSFPHISLQTNFYMIITANLFTIYIQLDYRSPLRWNLITIGNLPPCLTAYEEY